MSQYYYDPFGNSGVNEESQRAFLLRQQQEKEKKEIRIISLSMGIAIIAYLIIQTIVVFALQFLDLYDVYETNFVFQNAFNIIGISTLSVALPFGIMALVNKKRYESPIIPNKPIKLKNCLLWIGFGMFCSVVANIVVSYAIAFLEALTGLTFTQGESLDPSSIFDCVMLVISTAIIPAICEEFALRCCSLQLLRKYGKGFGVLTVSIVFGLLHGNVIQFLYAFIVGAILAYVTVKTDSIVPAVLIHALSNGMSVVQSIVTYAFGENSSDSVVVILYALWGIVGIASLIVLATKGAFKTEPKAKNDVLTFGQKISAFLFPWMILPFLILIGITITTIQK